MIAAILASRIGRAALVLALVAAVVGLQTLRLAHAKADLAHARVVAEQARAVVALSEDRRKAEHADAVRGLEQAEGACQARVAEAHRAAQAIRTLVEKPHAMDPNGCPVRRLLDAGELRDAIRPPA